ncbi:MAG: amidohydrolase family protein [Bacteroidota bacterium]
MRTFSFLSLLVLSGMLCRLPAQTTTYINVHVLDVESFETLQDQAITLEGGNIQAVQAMKKFKAGEGDIVKDMEGRWVIPGLVDAHVHFFQSGGLYTRPDAFDFRAIQPYEQERKELLAMAPDLYQRYLAAGLTRVCDVGGPMTNYDLRTQSDTLAASPTLYVTGPLISTYQPAAFQIEDSPIIKVSGPEEARALVRKQLPLKPDFIKIWYIVTGDQTAEQNLPIVQATIEESHAHHIPVAVHATQLKTARLAVEAGADILVHSVDDREIGDDFIELLKEKKVSYIPTLIVGDNYMVPFKREPGFTAADFRLAEPFVLGSLMDIRHLPEGIVPTYMRNLLKSSQRFPSKQPLMKKNLKKLVDAGVNVVTGTDAGNIGTLHASSFYSELSAMADAGMSPWELLKASSLNAARMLGQEDEWGTVSEGKTADLVFLSTNPLDSLSSLQHPFLILKNGQEFQQADLIRQDAEALAQRQLNAYNARDIDAFVACYHPEVKVYGFPNQEFYTGRETMRKNYSGMFEALPDLHCELVNRMVQGNVVIDQERVSGLPEGKVLKAIAIYTVEEGLITEVRFIQ